MTDPEAGSGESLSQKLERLSEGKHPDLSVAFLQAVMVHLPALVSAVDAQGRFLYVNKTIPELTVADVVGKTIFDFMPDERQHQVVRAAIARVMKTGEPDSYQGFGQGRAGPMSRYQNCLSPIRSGNEVIAVAMVTLDVSEEWSVQHTLEDRETRLSLALSASGLGMYRWDAINSIVELDTRAQAIYGRDQASFDADVFNSFLHPDDIEGMRHRTRQALETGEPYSHESRIIHSDGSTRWINAHGLPLYDEDKKPIGMLGTLAEVTERRQLDAQLRQAQKLEAVGQLTAGIAHNFNNMLASIIPTLDIIAAKTFDEDAPLVASAVEAGNRAAQMVRELLTFAGRNRPRARRVESPETLVERTLRICRTTFDRGIEIDLAAAEEIPPFEVDPAQIEQALLNILINARDALHGAPVQAPRVTVRIDAVDRGDEPTLPESPDHFVRLQIEDNGPGMSSNTRDRIFEPFFTTKQVGEGTGLGLSTTYAIIREHGGYIRCDSEPDRGSTFTVLLPATKRARETKPQTSERHASARTVVLVVDDEEVVRTVVERVLRDAEYEVHSAVDGDTAISMTEQVRPDVVLLDLNMPGLPWREVVHRLRAAHPDMKLVVYTGEGFEEEIEGVIAQLQKPATPEKLRQTLEEALAHSRDD